ncbi:MAG: response regulator transcription factor [Thiolinea sp.]
MVIEDNEMLLSGISKTLRDVGHSVENFIDGSKADQHLRHEGADLAIIDINLPGMDGLDITRRLRSRQQNFPVLILTARSSTEDRVNGLDAGADDYLVKPFAMAELEARVRALGRRRGTLQSEQESLGHLHYHYNSRRLFHGNKELELARREKMLFETLLEKRGQFVSKSLLADTLYGVGSDTDLNAVEIAISRLRRVLKGSGVNIRTARGIGYMLEADPE